MELEERFRSALTLAEFIDTAEANQSLWKSIYRRAAVPDWALNSARRLPERLRLLVLIEDWCADGLGSVPYLARLADLVPERLQLRVLRRDGNLDLMDAHLSPSGGRAIPVVLFLDDQGREIAWWGSRPAPLQAFFDGEGRTLSKEERFRYSRTWYARDRGARALREVLAIAGAELPPDDAAAA